jgi:hypothetical protein
MSHNDVPVSRLSLLLEVTGKESEMLKDREPEVLTIALQYFVLLNAVSALMTYMITLM